jgi:hypothetical protein
MENAKLLVISEQLITAIYLMNPSVLSSFKKQYDADRIKKKQ